MITFAYTEIRKRLLLYKAFLTKLIAVCIIFLQALHSQIGLHPPPPPITSVLTGSSRDHSQTSFLQFHDVLPPTL